MQYHSTTNRTHKTMEILSRILFILSRCKKGNISQNRGWRDFIKMLSVQLETFASTAFGNMILANYVTSTLMPPQACFPADFPAIGDASISNIFKSRHIPRLKFSFEFSTAEIVSICAKVTAVGMVQEVMKVRTLQHLSSRTWKPFVKRFFRSQ